MKKELEKFGQVSENVSLKSHNTYRIDSTAKYLLYPKDIESLIAFQNYALEVGIPYFILGNGSNVILQDSCFPGVVVKLSNWQSIEYQDEIVTVDAGVMINKLSYLVIEHNLKGLEWASGIPGTIGGSIYGNAGAYNSCLFDYLDTVTYLTQEGKIITKEASSIPHDYRTSFFKENPQYIILKATLRLQHGESSSSLALIEDRRQRRINTQPLEYPSAGSVFRNPSAEISSGKLIDDLGLKGTRIGDAMISLKHANFIINMGQATGKDIRNLISLIHDRVYEHYHIDLYLEQEYKSW